MEVNTESNNSKGMLSRAKDMVFERLKGAEQTAIDAIAKAQDEVIADIKSANDSVKASALKSSELSQKAAENFTKAESGTARIAELGDESAKLVENVRVKSDEAKSSQAQIHNALKSVETSEAEAKAHVKEMVGTKAEMKNQFTEIGQFYSEIGDRKAELLDLKKNTSTELSKISENFSASLEEYNERSESLIKQNETIGVEIRSHLQRAVGASLFSAFGTRKDKIIVGKWAWFAAMVVSMIIGVTWVYWMIDDLKGALYAAFAVRTVFGVMISYFIYFCSKQYDRERRAEEEYAFKAAISVSLKPFHDLLIESKNKEIDTEFMKQLMKEVFDNPVARLFNEGKTSSKLQINRQGLNGEHSVEPPNPK